MAKGSKGLLAVSILELVVGIILLIIYEAYKAKYIKAANKDQGVNGGFQTAHANWTTQGSETQIIDVSFKLSTTSAENGVTITTPLDVVFYLSIFLNIFSILGMFGIINSIKELVMIFFGWNAIQMIVAFSFFVDVATVAGINYLNTAADNRSVNSAAQAAAAFMFFAFLLSIAATFFAVKTVNEFKNKEREDALAINLANTALNNL